MINANSRNIDVEMSVRKVIVASLLETSPLLKQHLFSEGDREHWVHPINAQRDSCGEFHHLFNELKKDESRFQEYFRMSTNTFYTILELVSADLQKQETNYIRRPHRLHLA